MERTVTEDRHRFTIGTLARRTGCGIDTIRYYERMQLLPAVPRTSGGHRLYDDSHIRRLAFIRRSRMLGMSLDQVRGILGAIAHGDYSCNSMKALFTACAAAARQKIEELETVEDNLRTMIEACGDAGPVNCRAIDALLAGEDIPVNGRCCAEAW